MDAELVQGGGLLAFAVAIWTLLRDHLRKIEGILGQHTEQGRELAASQARAAAALESLGRTVGALVERRRIRVATPPAGNGFLDIDQLGETIDDDQGGAVHELPRNSKGS